MNTVQEDNKQRPKKAGPLGVMYVEVNNTNFINTGCYNLVNGEPLFDIGIIFAANINYDTVQRKAYLHFNNNVTRVLDQADSLIKPLQQRGIKVLLSILGNHQGAGICNFENEASARDFAILLANAVRDYDLDGIDFDDEYSEYGQNGTGQPNAYSFIYLLRELRALIPDKIISFYYYGPAASRLTYEDMTAGDFVNYSWNAIYGSYSVPNVPKLTKAQLGPAAVNVQSTSAATAQSLATRTVNEDYGIYLYYNLPNNNINTYLSGVSAILHQSQTGLVESGCLQGWNTATGVPMLEGDRVEMKDE